MGTAPDLLSGALSRCEATLRDQPQQRRDFEAWAVATLDELVDAERAGRVALQSTLAALRLHVLDLDRALGAADAQPSPEQLARRDWLQAVLQVVDELMGTTSRTAA